MSCGVAARSRAGHDAHPTVSNSDAVAHPVTTHQRQPRYAAQHKASSTAKNANETANALAREAVGVTGHVKVRSGYRRKASDAENGRPPHSPPRTRGHRERPPQRRHARCPVASRRSAPLQRPAVTWWPRHVPHRCTKTVDNRVLTITRSISSSRALARHKGVRSSMSSPTLAIPVRSR